MPFDITSIYDPIGPLVGRTGFTKDVSESMLGVEFENETKEPFSHPTVKNWAFHNEGSLRHYGFEYVLNEPMNIADTREAIHRLFKWIDQRKGIIPLTNSIRTSTHVHFDVTKWNYIDLLRFVIVYWILEDVLSSFCGETRKGNLFCLRLKDATYTQNTIAEYLSRGECLPKAITHNDYRYSSVNFSSVTKFGSIEFRLMRGVDNAKEACSWIDILEKIKEYSFKFNTPLDVREAFLKKHDAASYASDILGSELFGLVSSHLPKDFCVPSSVRDSFMYVSHIFSAHKTWDFKKDIEELKKKKEEQIAAAKKAMKAAYNYSDSDLAAILDAGYSTETPQTSSSYTSAFTNTTYNATEEQSATSDPDFGLDQVYFSDEEIPEFDIVSELQINTDL